MRVASLLSSGADVTAVGGWVCYYQYDDHVQYVVYIHNVHVYYSHAVHDTCSIHTNTQVL